MNETFPANTPQPPGSGETFPDTAPGRTPTPSTSPAAAINLHSVPDPRPRLTITRRAVQSELARRSLPDFARRCVPGFCPTPFHTAYYRTLDAFAKGLVRRLIVGTRWHEEDLPGRIAAHERVVGLTDFSQLGTLPPDCWLMLNFEAIKESPPTPADPRDKGEALWPARHSRALLDARRRLDPHLFEALYQGRPASKEGLLYGEGFATYDELPATVVKRGNYTDTADTGDDYLCSLCYAVGGDGMIYLTDALYTPEPMEATEPQAAAMLRRADVREALFESNNGGRGFARAVGRLVPEVRIAWTHQSRNKEARILSNSATVQRLARWPRGWEARWPELARDLLGYRRLYRANRRHDAPDALTGVVETELDRSRRTIRAVGFRSPER